MTPDVQAAADRVTAWLAHETRIASDFARQAAVVLTFDDHEQPFPTLHASDLRLLLAALDPAEQPIDRVPTKAGLDYLAIRHEQHPRTVRDFRAVQPQPNGEPA